MCELDTYEMLKYRTEVDEYGIRYYYDNSGQLRRIDGALHSAWYQNGQKHRTDGPAVELADGTKSWYQNGKRHRIDGAAIEYSDGGKRWYINGEELTEAEFNQRVKSL